MDPLIVELYLFWKREGITRDLRSSEGSSGCVMTMSFDIVGDCGSKDSVGRELEKVGKNRVSHCKTLTLRDNIF
jgi:hypothetical protein